MGRDKRTFIVSNLYRDEVNDINNDVNITLPDSIFSGKIESINLKHMFIDYEYETIGTSNYQLSIAYPSTGQLVSINLNLSQNATDIVRTDEDLASLLAASINTTLGTNVFQVYYNNVITYTRDVYRDNSDLLSSYTIFTSNGVEFSMDFSSKVSIGPLIGFGNKSYTGNYTYKGGNIPPLYGYESIHIANQAYSSTFKQYDNYTDIACKMDLYDNNGVLIENYLDARDTTISLPIEDGYIYNVNDLTSLIATELNRYSSNFPSPQPTFSVAYDYTSHKITIATSPATVFGIGFRFDRGDGRNNYGSLHRYLGFQKKLYLGATSYTGIQPAAIFEQAYIAEYLFVCSDLIKYNYDASLIVTGSNSSATFYECVFSIPISQINNNSYVPTFSDEHVVPIHASLFAKRYTENLSDPKTINFYLKTSSGRHIKLNTQWSLKIEIEYIN